MEGIFEVLDLKCAFVYEFAEMSFFFFTGWSEWNESKRFNEEDGER